MQNCGAIGFGSDSSKTEGRIKVACVERQRSSAEDCGVETNTSVGVADRLCVARDGRSGAPAEFFKSQWKPDADAERPGLSDERPQDVPAAGAVGRRELQESHHAAEACAGIH